jgi:hypothetical protein
VSSRVDILHTSLRSTLSLAHETVEEAVDAQKTRGILAIADRHGWLVGWCFKSGSMKSLGYLSTSICERPIFTDDDIFRILLHRLF